MQELREKELRGRILAGLTFFQQRLNEELVFYGVEGGII